MSKFFSIIASLFVLFQMHGCATGSQIIMEEPQPEKSLLVGAILLENNGVEDVFESKTANIRVVVVGKSSIDGREEGYRVKTDENGYFMIPNVPPGAYVIKGIEVDLGYETRLLLTSRWEGNIQLYYPIDTIIDYTVRLWPESTDEKIINLQINYFSIDQAFRAIHRRFENLNNTSLLLMDKSYTMENPETYFKIRYPHSNWF
ncbi:MAG: carboxypeptidase regulatory-like domain-containing protein [Calditrichae bacterium]|nr:carboxypeptidase regulatory-like domain-containing protein [Calditrichia bacterium]